MAGLVLTHGAGGNRNSPLLVAVAGAFEQAGYNVERVDLSYRQKRPTGPPRRGDADRDREGLRQAVEAMRGRARGPVLLGGASYGGRQASMLVAENPVLVDGLLLLSYPLHPPGKPDRLRTEHLPKIQAPALFAHGTRDPFGSIEELREAMKLIPARTELLEVTGAGHDLKKGQWDVSVLPLFFRPNEPANQE